MHLIRGSKMKKEDWEKALSAWERVENQAYIDLAQSKLYKESIEKKIKELEKGE